LSLLTPQLRIQGTSGRTRKSRASAAMNAVSALDG
jgi:hypothetical protein